MEKQFKNLDELYNCTNYFYKFNRYCDYIKLEKGNFKPYLINKINGEKIQGLKNINKYLEMNNIEFEK